MNYNLINNTALFSFDDIPLQKCTGFNPRNRYLSETEIEARMLKSIYFKTKNGFFLP